MWEDALGEQQILMTSPGGRSPEPVCGVQRAAGLHKPLRIIVRP